MVHPNICNKCGADLDDSNWNMSDKAKHHYICRPCHNKKNNTWRKNNPEKNRIIRAREWVQRGHVPMDQNRTCASFLGIHVAEQVLAKVFASVKVMPHGNRGYDFVCSKNKLVDVKSSCEYVLSTGAVQWIFHIDKNKIADYFLCLAFDNRYKLTPLYMWLIPGHVLNDKMNTSIASSTIHKWDDYALPIDKVVSCCDTMRGESK